MTVLGDLLLGFGILIGIVLIYLIVIVFFPALSVPGQPIPTRSTGKERKGPPACRQDAGFSVDETHISAWLYLQQFPF